MVQAFLSARLVQGLRFAHPSESLPIVDASYRLGLSIVTGAVALAAAVVVAFVGPTPAPRPAAQSLEPRPIGPFALTERSGRAVAERDLADRVWVAAFVFTRCP